MKSTFKQSLTSAVATLGVTSIASCIKLNSIFGTWCSFFSASQLTLPLAGAFGGPLATFMTYGISFLASGSVPVHGFMLGLPTLSASLYLSSSGNWFLKALIPLICIALFISHPVGFQALPYALYWCIPLAIACCHTNALFARALGATFTAHALGSVIFLYTKVTEPSLWYGLITIVPLERFVFAAGISILYLAVEGIIKLSQKISVRALITTSE